MAVCHDERWPKNYNFSDGFAIDGGTIKTVVIALWRGAAVEDQLYWFQQYESLESIIITKWDSL